MKRPHITVIAFLFAAACGSPTEPSSGPLALGWWTNSTGSALHVEQAQSTLFLGCYYGVFPTPTLDKNGNFKTNGFIRGGPGPVEQGSGAPVTFSGHAVGSVLTITVSSDFKLFGSNTHTYDLRFDGPTPKNPITPPCA
jgi:hypothetical protein